MLGISIKYEVPVDTGTFVQKTETRLPAIAVPLYKNERVPAEFPKGVMNVGLFTLDPSGQKASIVLSIALTRKFPEFEFEVLDVPE